jgi:hypothetical protein
VTVLEFAPPELEEQQKDPPQEGGAEEEDLLECPNHHPTTFIKGKPRSIIILLIFSLSCPRINHLWLYSDALSVKR